MNEQKWEEEIRELIEKRGLDVVEIRREARGKTDIIKIFVDKDGGVTISDCKNAAKFVDALIEEHNLITKDYRLEVSSPGLDRPLKTGRDFNRKIDKRISVTFDKDGKTETIEGKLTDVSENEIIIEGKKESFKISFDTIIKGKIVLPW